MSNYRISVAYLWGGPWGLDPPENKNLVSKIMKCGQKFINRKKMEIESYCKKLGNMSL